MILSTANAHSTEYLAAPYRKPHAQKTPCPAGRACGFGAQGSAGEIVPYAAFQRMDTAP